MGRRELLALSDVVDFHDLRLAGVDAHLLEDRHQVLAVGFELLPCPSGDS